MQQPIVRHYRAATREEVEQAYLLDAGRAAAAGYLPVNQSWAQEAQGLLLAVTYRRSGPTNGRPEPAAAEAAVAAVESTPSAPQVAVAPPEEPEPSPVGAVEPDADQFAPAGPPEALEQFAPAAGEEPGVEVVAEVVTEVEPAVEPEVAPVAEPEVAPEAQAQVVHEAEAASAEEERYSPPDEFYIAPPDMYEQMTVPGQPEAEAEATIDETWLEPEADEQSTGAYIAPPAEPSDAEPAPVPALARPAVGRQARLTIQTMDLHCAGEPLRIIRSGFPDVPDLPVLERRQWVMDNADHVRRTIVNEPRGHRDMYGAILLPPHSDYADMTVLFMHNEGYSTMCGHGVIAITTGLIEEGLFPATEPVTTIRYEVPAGIVAANATTAQLADGSWAVDSVRFTNVPAYVAAQSLAVRPDGIELHGNAAQYGAVAVDIGFGGAYYGIVNAADLGLRVVPDQAHLLRSAGAAITDVLRRDHSPAHPTDEALSFVYGTIIVDYDPRTSPDGRAERAHIRNATVFADAELDRSPCGSGTSAILAMLHARGRVRVGQEIVNAGITGEHFLGRIEAETALGPYPAVSTSIAGTAFVTGYSTFVVDDRDPLGEGFLLS